MDRKGRNKLCYWTLGTKTISYFVICFARLDIVFVVVSGGLLVKKFPRPQILNTEGSYNQNNYISCLRYFWYAYNNTITIRKIQMRPILGTVSFCGATRTDLSALKAVGCIDKFSLSRIHEDFTPAVGIQSGLRFTTWTLSTRSDDCGTPR